MIKVKFVIILLITVTGRLDVNKAFSRVTEGKVNRGAGYGLEMPCVYQFYGPKPYIDHAVRSNVFNARLRD